MRIMLMMILIWTLTISLAIAGNFRDEEGGVQIDIPDDWTVDFNDNALMAKPADGNAGVVLIVLPSSNLESALNELGRELTPIIKDFQQDGEPEEFEINGMRAIGIEGVGRIDGVDSELAIALIHTPTNKVLMAILGVAAAMMDTHKDVMESISQSIRPL